MFFKEEIMEVDGESYPLGVIKEGDFCWTFYSKIGGMYCIESVISQLVELTEEEKKKLEDSISNSSLQGTRGRYHDTSVMFNGTEHDPKNIH